VGEEQLLDWIDGRLPASEMARLEASSGRQGLGDRVRQMQANRRAMRSMPLEKAPPELMGRVLQALERELVLGWQDGTQSQDGGTIAQELEPISFEEHRGTTPPWLPRLAMAAGVALLLAGGTYWAMLLTAPTATPGTLADAGTGGVEIAAKSNAEQGSEQLALASGSPQATPESHQLQHPAAKRSPSRPRPSRRPQHRSPARPRASTLHRRAALCFVCWRDARRMASRDSPAGSLRPQRAGASLAMCPPMSPLLCSRRALFPMLIQHSKVRRCRR
jgi:hypothetical protein